MFRILIALVFTFMTALPVVGDAAPLPPRVGINGAGCAYETIQAAVNAAVSGDTIQVCAGIYYEDVNISTEDLTISGDYGCDCITTGGGTATVVGSGSGSVFDITGGVVTLQNLQITGGNDDIGGGIDLLSGAQVTLSNTDVFSNTGSNGGGAYVTGDCQLTLDHSSIYNNTATVAGGGARVWGTLIANDTYSDIYNNSAPNGGGLSVAGGTVQLIDSDMSGNQATGAAGRGGAI